MTWQPIDTAPKDGTEVLVYFGGRVGVKSAAWTGSSSGLTIWCVDDEKHGPFPVRGYSEPYPTHWMPLPAAPEAV